MPAVFCHALQNHLRRLAVRNVAANDQWARQARAFDFPRQFVEQFLSARQNDEPTTLVGQTNRYLATQTYASPSDQGIFS